MSVLGGASAGGGLCINGETVVACSWAMRELSWPMRGQGFQGNSKEFENS